MRIASDKADAGYINFCQLRRRGKVVITLDGVKQSHVTVADEEAGFVTRFVLKDGKAQVDPTTGNSVLVETVKGKVAISVEAET